ncbi:MAG: hypothetical protein ACRYGK_14285 [Janthinobacterium lividum]
MSTRLQSIRKTALLSIACSMLLCSAVRANSDAIPPFPRPPKSSAALEKSLQRWDAAQLAHARECADSFQQSRNSPDDGLFDLRYAVTLDTPSLYSVEVNLEDFCGGAYPSRETTAVVFDKRTGKEYSPLALYGIAQPSRFGLELKAEIKSMLRRRLLAARAGLDDQECRKTLEEDPLSSFEPDMSGFGKDGLRIYYSGPHVVQACYETVVLPYSGIANYLNRKEALRVKWPKPD